MRKDNTLTWSLSKYVRLMICLSRVLILSQLFNINHYIIHFINKAEREERGKVSLNLFSR